MVEHEEEPKRFAPKVPVQLDPPKYDPISYEELAKCDGMSCPSPSVKETVSHLSSLIAITGSDSSRPTLVAIKGIVFDVSRNPAYGPTGQYRGMFCLLP